VYNIRGVKGIKRHTGNGIVLSSVDSGMIEYCTAFNNGEFCENPTSGGPIGIWVWDSRGVTIQFCESYDNKTGNFADGGGFDLDGGCVNCIMQYNYSHGNHGAGYGIYQYSNAREFKNNIVRYNISKNDGLNNKYGGIYLFIKQWLPELAEIPSSMIHEPWKMTGMDQQMYHCRIEEDYPSPVVDITHTYKKASKALWAKKKEPLVCTEARKILSKQEEENRVTG